LVYKFYMIFVRVQICFLSSHISDRFRTVISGNHKFQLLEIFQGFRNRTVTAFAEK